MTAHRGGGHGHDERTLRPVPFDDAYEIERMHDGAPYSLPWWGNIIFTLVALGATGGFFVLLSLVAPPIVVSGIASGIFLLVVVLMAYLYIQHVRDQHRR